ncbi:MAG: M23 family metallopeptidase [Elusimicrobia bacterium]|nr:M23 family metallopeptidase [Candidatus Obscuribacterium magneticum]
MNNSNRFITSLTTACCLLACAFAHANINRLPFPRDPNGNRLEVDSDYGPRDVVTASFFHPGLDLNEQGTTPDGDLGLPVLAQADGSVFGTGMTSNGLKWMGIDYGNGRQLAYLHLFESREAKTVFNYKYQVAEGTKTIKSVSRTFREENINDGILLFWSEQDGQGELIKAISHSSAPFVVNGATITPRTTVLTGEVIGPLGKSGGVPNAHLHIQVSSPDPRLDNTKTASGVGNDGNDNVITYLEHDRSEFTGRISSPTAGSYVFHTASHDNERLVVSINKKNSGTPSTFNGYDFDRANFYLLPSSADISADILAALTDDKRVNKSRARVTPGDPNSTLPDTRDNFQAEIDYGGRPDAEPHPLYLDNTETPPKGRTGTETGFHTGFQVLGQFPDYNRYDIVFNQWNSRVRKNFESLYFL